MKQKTNPLPSYKIQYIWFKDIELFFQGVPKWQELAYICSLTQLNSVRLQSWSVETTSFQRTCVQLNNCQLNLMVLYNHVTPTALPAYLPFIYKECHDTSKCRFNNLSRILPSSAAEQLPFTGARSCRKSTNFVPFTGLFTLWPAPRWVEAQMDIVENCPCVDSQTSMKMLNFFVAVFP